MLESFGVTVEHFRPEVGRIVGSGNEVPTGQIPFTPRAKKVLELAPREWLTLGHNYIGTEHILLGLVCENEEDTARTAGGRRPHPADFDADPYRIRTEMIQMLSGTRAPQPAELPPEDQRGRLVIAIELGITPPARRRRA